jgi:hypothetical protein
MLHGIFLTMDVDWMFQSNSSLGMWAFLGTVANLRAPQTKLDVNVIKTYMKDKRCQVK